MAKRSAPSRRSPAVARPKAKSRQSRKVAASTPRERADALRLQQRAEELLTTEIDFIANDSFVGRRDLPGDTSEFVSRVEQGFSVGGGRSAAGLPAHLARLCETPLLTPEQERDVFRRMNFCKYRANAIRSRLSASNPDAKQLNQIQDYLDRAERLRNYIVSANTRLVVSIARKFADARNLFDDLLSQGLSSLMHSVEKFDYDRGYRFSTYATCAVRRDLYRSVMSKKKDAQRFATGADEYLSSTTDHRVDEDAISEAGYRSLKRSLGEMLELLDERERLILQARFGLDGGRKKASYSRLGERLGISKERVRQLANRALDKMRDVVPEYGLEAMLT